MAQTLSLRHPRFEIPEEIRILGHEETDDTWPWRDALLLMAIWCILVWVGIGFVIVQLIR